MAAQLYASKDPNLFISLVVGEDPVLVAFESGFYSTEDEDLVTALEAAPGYGRLYFQDEVPVPDEDTVMYTKDEIKLRALLDAMVLV